MLAAQARPSRDDPRLMVTLVRVADADCSMNRRKPSCHETRYVVVGPEGAVVIGGSVMVV